MIKEKFGVAVAEDIAKEIDKLVDECEDLGASRFEIIEAILTAYIQLERMRGEHTLEFTPDNCAPELLCVGVAQTLKNRFSERLLTVFREVEATAMVDGTETVFDDLWVI